MPRRSILKLYMNTSLKEIEEKLKIWKRLINLYKRIRKKKKNTSR